MPAGCLLLVKYSGGRASCRKVLMSHPSLPNKALEGFTMFEVIQHSSTARRVHTILDRMLAVKERSLANTPVNTATWSYQPAHYIPPLMPSQGRQSQRTSNWTPHPPDLTATNVPPSPLTLRHPPGHLCLSFKSSADPRSPPSSSDSTSPLQPQTAISI